MAPSRAFRAPGARTVFLTSMIFVTFLYTMHSVANLQNAIADLNRERQKVLDRQAGDRGLGQAGAGRRRSCGESCGVLFVLKIACCCHEN